MRHETAVKNGPHQFSQCAANLSPLEAGIIPHDFELVAAPPAILNEMMARGELQVSSCSCIEYARHPEQYFLARDLSIGSPRAVMSVLLLSRHPVEQLEGKEILISGESHTSVALLKLLMKNYYNVHVNFRSGRVTTELRGPNPPEAFWPLAMRHCACAAIPIIQCAWISQMNGGAGLACPLFLAFG